MSLLVGLKHQGEMDPVIADEFRNVMSAIQAAFNGLSNVVNGLTTGYKIARGQWTTVTAIDTLATGLTTVSCVVASLESAPVLGCMWAEGVVGNQAGVPAAGNILIRTYKPTAAGDVTPLAATTFGKKVNWIAIGT